MFKKIDRVLTWIETIVGTTGYISMFFLILAGCIARYVFNSPIKWVEEVTNLILIWSGYLAICYATSSGGHVSIDFLTNLLSKRAKEIWNAVLQLIILVTFAILLKPSIDAIKFQITTPALHLSLKVLFTIMPGTCILIMLHNVINIIGLLFDEKEEKK